MKFSSTLLVMAMAAATTSAFVVVAPTAPRRAMQLQSRADASAAIQAAQEATKKYGPTSPEAKVAWDTVEEMDSSDNR